MFSKILNYWNKLLIYLYCTFRIIEKKFARGKAEQDSKEIVVISIQHMGESILFCDCLREIRRFYSTDKGYSLRFYGNKTSVNYYKSYLDEYIDEYVAVDVDFNLDERNQKIGDFLRICRYIQSKNPEIIIMPFKNYWGIVISAAVSSKEQWRVERKYKYSQSILMKYITRHSANHTLYEGVDDMLFATYGKLLRSMGISSYKAKIGRITVKPISDKRENDLLRGVKDYCVIVPGSLESARRWEASKFAEIVDYIVDKFNIACIIVGSNDERELCQQVASLSDSIAIRKGKVVNLAGITTIDELAYIINGARFVFGNDTGTVHLTAAIGKPYIALLSCKDYGIYLPYFPETENEDDILPIVLTQEEKPYCVLCHINSQSPNHRINWVNENCKNEVLNGKPFLCLGNITTTQAKSAIDQLIGE